VDQTHAGQVQEDLTTRSRHRLGEIRVAMACVARKV